MAKQAKMVVDKAFSISKIDTVLLLSILEELYTMEFISRDIRFPMRTDSAKM